MQFRFYVFLQNGRFQTYPYKPNGWTHAVLNYIGPSNGEGIRIFYNGAQVASDTSNDGGSHSAGDGRIVVGRYNTGEDGNYASVEVDELIFFNRSLSTLEIRTLHSNF